MITRDPLALLSRSLLAHQRAFPGGVPRYGFATSMAVLRCLDRVTGARGDGGGGVGVTGSTRVRPRCRACGRFHRRSHARAVAAAAERERPPAPLSV